MSIALIALLNRLDIDTMPPKNSAEEQQKAQDQAIEYRKPPSNRVDVRHPRIRIRYS